MAHTTYLASGRNNSLLATAQTSAPATKTPVPSKVTKSSELADTMPIRSQWCTLLMAPMGAAMCCSRTNDPECMKATMAKAL